MEILETSRFAKLADDYFDDERLSELKTYLGPSTRPPEPSFQPAAVAASCAGEARDGENVAATV